MRALLTVLALLPLSAMAVVPVATSTGSSSHAHAGAQVVAPHVVAHLALGGIGGWDYPMVDGASHRLYLSRGDRVMVVDTGSGKTVGEITHTDGVHGVALAPRHGVGFTSNGKASTVSVFDLKSLRTLADIAIPGRGPDAILYDRASDRVLTFNGKSEDITVIDAGKRTVVATIKLDGNPEFAASDGKGHVLVNIESKGEVAQLDPRAAKVLATWTLGGCEEPTGLAVDVVHRRTFSVCQNGMMVVLDADTGRRVAQLPIGAGPDGAAFDPKLRLAYSANGHDGTMTVVHEDDPEHFRVLANVPTQVSARTITLDEASHHVYLPAANFGPLPADAPEHTRPPMLPDSFSVVVLQP
jgi:YVTN family beta-propeller protein